MSTSQSSIQDSLTFDEFSKPEAAQWREEAEAALKGAPFDKKLVTSTPEGIAIQPIYTSADVANIPGLASAPGEAPFLRGATTNQTWEVAQETFANDAQGFNASVRNDLMRGQTAVVLRPQSSIHPDGVRVCCVRDYAEALDGIDVSVAPLIFEPGGLALPHFAELAGALQQNSRNLTKVRGWISQDPLNELASTGRLAASLARAYDDMASVTAWCAAILPNFGSIGVSTVAYHNAGASAVQELACALASGVEYLRELEARDIGLDNAAKAARFTFGIGPDFFMAIAKIRAARQLWAQLLEACEVESANQRIWIHAVTSETNKSRLDVHVNTLRSSTEAVSAVLAGCQSLEIAPFDKPIRTPDEFSRRLARNTQIILAEECRFDHVSDPAGGAYYVEKLTSELVDRAWATFQDIERAGGMSAALRAGKVQADIAKVAAQRTSAVALRRSSLIGVNVYANAAERIANASKAQDISRQETKPAPVSNATGLDRLARSAMAHGNDVVDAAVTAALGGATVDDLSAALAERRGPALPEEVAALPKLVLSQPFEELRERAENLGRPRVFLATMGPLRQHKARADFSQDFFRAGGFDIIENNGFKTPADAADAAAGSGAPVVVICSTDETYPEIVPALVGAIKAHAPATIVVVAGYPKDHIDAFRASGVDEFIHIRSDCYETLRALLDKIAASTSGDRS